MVASALRKVFRRAWGAGQYQTATLRAGFRLIRLARANIRRRCSAVSLADLIAGVDDNQSAFFDPLFTMADYGDLTTSRQDRGLCSEPGDLVGPR